MPPDLEIQDRIKPKIGQAMQLLTNEDINIVELH